MTGLHLEELTEEITEQAGRLEGPLEAAALVEALHPLEAGGRPLAPGDALELGSAVFEQQSLDPESARRAAEAERRRRMAWPRRDRPRQMAGLPLLPDHRAAALVTPTVLALAAVSVATLPLWASARPRPAQATAVGLGAVAFSAFINRLVCTNGLIVKVADLGGFRRRHWGRPGESLSPVIQAALTQVLGAADEAGYRFARLAEQAAPWPVEAFIERTARRMELSRDDTHQVVAQREGDTLYDVVNAFTLVAQAFPVAERVRVETAMSRFLRIGGDDI